MSYQVGRVCWSQTMDLLALVTLDNVLELIRISYKAQKVFQVEEKEPITALTFSPDCKLLVNQPFSSSMAASTDQSKCSKLKMPKKCS